MMKTTAVCLAALCLWGLPGTGAERPPLKVCLVSGSAEYDSDITLPILQKILGVRTTAVCTILKARGFGELPGLEALDSCDVALFFTRRLTIDGEALERVKRYCTSGRPIVAVRTASHGFQKWSDFDRLVLGGNYNGHYGPGAQEARMDPEAKDHPVLEGVKAIRSRASLYRTVPLSADAKVLMWGSSTATADTHPVAWTRTCNGGRVFYTSLGDQDDFENSMFQRLLVNAIYWTAGRKVERRDEEPLKPLPPKAEGDLLLRLRSRMETAQGSGVWQETIRQEKVPAAQAAILVCDLWNQHWCRGATERCDVLAARMGPVLEAARARGLRIIHAPSETMDFYADGPQRRRMEAVKPVEPPKVLEVIEPPLPIDDSDGGCDTPEKPWHRAWTRQSPRIRIGEADLISDSGPEIYGFLRAEGITTLIYMGVHTNMCVLGRPFGIRAMTRAGLRCILVRDLTDAMYDPQDPPRVPHAEGTELVVRHIEMYWGPSTTAEEVLKAAQ